MNDGTFKDTLKVEKPQVYFIETNPTKGAPIHLSNGYDLVLTGDLKNFQDKYFLFWKRSLIATILSLSQINFSKEIIGDNPMELFALEKIDFDKKVNKLKTGMDSLLNHYKDLDSTLLQ